MPQVDYGEQQYTYGGPDAESMARFGRSVRKEDLRGKSPREAASYLDAENVRNANSVAALANNRYQKQRSSPRTRGRSGRK